MVQNRVHTDGDHEDFSVEELRQHLCPAPREVRRIDMDEKEEGGAGGGGPWRRTAKTSLWDLLSPQQRNAFRPDETVTLSMAEFYLFCAERHATWVRRNRDDVPPWTRNPILQFATFTESLIGGRPTSGRTC